MRFCDLFISYKIGLKGIKNTIPFTKLPMYRKIFSVIIFANSITSAILVILKLNLAAYSILALNAIAFIVFTIFDSSKRNLETMLKEHYAPYSKKRMHMVIDVLHSYEIDIHNSDLIDYLIEETQKAKIQSDYLAPLKKPLKTLSAIIIPIIVYISQKIADSATQNEMIIMAVQTIILILLIFSIIFSLSPIIKEFLYRDYNKYDELICDLRQIKLFYASQKDTTSSN